MKVPDHIKKHEIDLGRGVFKADGQEDHDRMMKALESARQNGLGAFQRASEDEGQGCEADRVDGVGGVALQF